MKRFKKVYIEITNCCNLNCSFCIGNKRKKKIMSFDDFKIILDKIRPYTDYLYFHILGEPLLHPNVNEFIDYAYDMGFNVNITTNGYLIDKIRTNNIRQINISLHSFDLRYGVGLEDYLFNIFNSISRLNNVFISYRVWLDNGDDILKMISNYYNVSFDFSSFDKVKLSDNVFLSQFHEFIWPDLNNNYYSEVGKCYGLIDHIGILCDGTIVPCCLDSNGDISLGNIFNDSLDDVMNSDLVLNMIDGFKRGYKCSLLCRHCNFLENKKEN
jgi:MoaA/NifB/PqqE/SkfB family radical SAM enzyme